MIRCFVAGVSKCCACGREGGRDQGKAEKNGSLDIEEVQRSSNAAFERRLQHTAGRLLGSRHSVTKRRSMVQRLNQAGL